ncbi:MAG: hypothetical protein IAE63_06565 [Alphaproteobacteria bacterium]|jgi:hypothetical protein|nr:hypothetical protein [Alphaproteobacteria bacterium]
MGYRKAERGSVFFVILIGVAIFAALSYAVSQGFRVGGGTFDAVNHDKAELEMSSVLDFMHAVQNGFQEMKLNGIDPTSITFDRPTDVSYGIAPHTLKVFHPDGEGVIFIPVWSTLDDPSEVTATDWSFVRNTIEGVGGSGNEVIAALVRVPEKLCERINFGMVGDSTIPSESGDMSDMFETAVSPVDSINCAACVGKSALCVRNGNVRVFYFVLDRG